MTPLEIVVMMLQDLRHALNTRQDVRDRIDKINKEWSRLTHSEKEMLVSVCQKRTTTGH